MEEYIVLCDFDGTITLEDTCVSVLNKFANGDWEKYDEDLSNGLINLQECMQKQFRMIETDIPKIKTFLGNITLRRGFIDFVNYCEARRISIIVVSAGLNFIIQHTLEKNNLSLPIISAKVINECYDLQFPKLNYADSVDFKFDQVKFYQTQQKKVIFIGDGITDSEGAKQADLVFAVKCSYLNSLFKDYSFSDFTEIIEKFNSLIN